MPTPARFTLGSPLVAALSFPALALGCASPSAPVAASPLRVTSAAPVPYRAVHIDSVAPDKEASFVGARLAFVNELHRLHTTDSRGTFIETDASRFYTFRPLTRFAELDARTDAVNAALANVPKEALDSYDKGCDDALVFPHASELWAVDTDLAYAPPGGGVTEETAACGQMVQEDVRPDPASGNRFWNAEGEIDRALADVHYPLTRVTFRSAFGAGHLVTLWLAHSKGELDGAPTVEAALTQARGEAKAKELLAAVEASVAHRETHAITVRHNLSSL